MSFSTPSQGGAGAVAPAIARYDKSVRRRLRKLAKSVRRFGDLIQSFPAAAFAIATHHGPSDRRRDAVRLVKDGAPLKKIAAALGLPPWLRMLPPEAFAGKLPEAALRQDDEAFGRKIANVAPKSPERAAMWLAWVLEARVACDDAFAIWLAGADCFTDPRPLSEDAAAAPPETLAPLAAFAWMSRYGIGPGRAQLAANRWRRQATFFLGVSGACDWVDRLITLECAGVTMTKASLAWRRREVVDGFEITPLTTAAQLRREGQVMNHCVATYAEDVARGRCLIYAIRRDGAPIATMEVIATGSPGGRGRIVQLMGRSNRAPSAAVAAAATRWLRDKRNCPCAPRHGGGLDLDQARWEQIWTPYWEARGRRGALRPDAGPETQWRLRRDLGRLSALAS